MRNPRKQRICMTATVLLGALWMSSHGPGASAAAQDAASNGTCSYGGFGLIGVSCRAAGYQDLLRFAEELAADASFRELLVRHVSQKEYGVQFVYVGTDVDREFMSRLHDRVKRRFGRNSLGEPYTITVTTAGRPDRSYRSAARPRVLPVSSRG